MIDFTDKKAVAKAIQYTNVSSELTRDGMAAHLKTCVAYGFQAAMIAPCFVSFAKDVLAGTGIKIASTVNFPTANDTLGMKIAVLRLLAKEGADELDFPPNPGLLLGGEEKAYFEELRQMAHVAHEEGMVIKSMLEFGYITTPELQAKAGRYSSEAGIDWVKQSSGWGKGGCEAIVEHVKILKANVELPCRVKVSGKVNTREKMQALFEAGAELVGTSSGPAIVDGVVGNPNAY
jgi:deoxyribose-phosphate aldolase